MAGAVFGEISGDSRGAKCCVFPFRMRLDSDMFNLRERLRRVVFMLGSWSNRPSIGGSI